MPKDNMDRAIKKGTGGRKDNLRRDRLQGYGPGGAARCAGGGADPTTATAPSRHTQHLYQKQRQYGRGLRILDISKKGLIAYDKSVDFDQLFEAAIEAEPTT